MKRITNASPLFFFAFVALWSSSFQVFSDVTVRGHVYLWDQSLNGGAGNYRPVKRVKVELEGNWLDTDPQGVTDDNGYYELSQRNPIFPFTSHDVNIEVYADVAVSWYDSWIQVFESASDIWPYSQESGVTTVESDQTLTLNLHIRGYGVAEWHWMEGAFLVCQEALEHRLYLSSLGLDLSEFEEKEFIYPAAPFGAVSGYFSEDVYTPYYNPATDYINLVEPENNTDPYFGKGVEDFKNTVRHEYSHGIMGDYWYTWPLGDFPQYMFYLVDGHSLWKRTTPEFAWAEGWAEFLEVVTQPSKWPPNTNSGAYGSWSEDREDSLPDWQAEGISGKDVEGDVAGCLWDIFDAVGFERGRYQYDDIPGTEQFYDGISDPNLQKIWTIFTTYTPDSFYESSGLLNAEDSFIWYWVHNTNYDQLHQLVAILYNRGIGIYYFQPSPTLLEQSPEISILDVTVNSGFEVQVDILVTEFDSIDREHVRMGLWIKDSFTTNWEEIITLDDVNSRLTTGWNGSTNQLTLTASTNNSTLLLNAHTSGTLCDVDVLVAVHDDMLAAHDRTNSIPLPCSVQSRITNIPSGSTAILKTGSYKIGAGNLLDFQGKSVTLESASGASVSVIPETSGIMTIQNSGPSGVSTIQADANSIFSMGSD